jgi:hypothetical protein
VAALNAITAANPTAADPWAVHVEPGDYEFTSTPPQVPGHVSIRGAGVEVTTLRCGSCIPIQSDGPISVADLTVRSASSQRTVDVGQSRFERVLIENTNTSGDALVVDGGDLTLIDSVLRTRPTAETSVFQQALLVSNAEVLIEGSVTEGFRPRVRLTNVDGTIRGSSLVSVFLASGTNDLRISNTTFDATGTFLSGSGLLTMATDSTGTKAVRLNDVEMIGYSSPSELAVQIGSNTTVVMEHSSVVNGRIQGAGGSIEARHITVEAAVSVTNETCFASVRIDTGTFTDVGCP